MIEKFDVAIIGAGIIGLSIAHELSRKGKHVCLVEKHESFGKETSSRNSEVIHSGIYYPKESLKARFCVEGNKLLYELCAKKNIAHRKVGKMVVALDDSETIELEKLMARGKNNGVEGLRMLSRREILELEPAVTAIAALYSPSTGIIDSHSLMKYLETVAKEHGALINYCSEAVAIEKKEAEYAVTIKEPGGLFSFHSTAVVNCAGLYSDKIAEMAGINIDSNGYRLRFCKGEYFNVSGAKAGLVKRLIYPVPHLKSGGLGTHVTIDLQGNLRLGPDAVYTDKIDYTVNPAKSENFYKSVHKFLPQIELSDLEPGMAGIRPKLQTPNEDFRDFIIRNEQDKSLPGFVNLIGIESPGITSCLAIAQYVSGII